MKHLLLALFATVAIAACGKKDAPAASVPAATPTSTVPAATTPVAAAPAGIPAECAAYFKQVETCVAKMGAAGEAFKSSMEQMKASLSANPAAQATAAETCKQGAEAFKPAAAAMKC
jgi:Family of unknown function (DUF5339)